MTAPAHRPLRRALAPLAVILLFALGWFAGGRSQAPEPVAGVTLGGTTRFVDVPGDTTIEQVSDPFWADRFSSPARMPASIPPWSRVWHRILIENLGAEPRTLVLEMGNRDLSEVDLYVPTQIPGTFERQSGAARLAPAGRGLDGAPVAFPIELAARAAIFVYVRTADDVARRHDLGALRLWETREDFERGRRSASAWNGFYLGLLVAVLAYLCVVHAALRRRDTAVYILHLFAFGLVQCVLMDLHLLVLPDRAQLWIERAPGLLLMVAALLLAVCWAISQARPSSAATRVGLAAIAAGVALLPFAPGLWPAQDGGTWARILADGARLATGWQVATLAGLALAAVVRTARGIDASHALAPAFAPLLGAWIRYALEVGEGSVRGPALLPLQAASALQLTALAAAVGILLRQLRREREALAATYTARLEQDVSDRTRELAAANSAKDRLFSIIAHDLRGPLNGVVALADQMARRPADFQAAEIAAVAEDIRDSGQQLRETLDNLLGWARVQTGQLIIRPHRFALLEVADGVARLFRGSLRRRRITLELDVPGSLSVETDFEAAKTIVRNLLSNAVKFSPEGARIRVTARSLQDGRTSLSVADSGPGMDAETLAGLFRPRPAGRPPGTEEAGAGLGLVLCRELSERIGATFGVDSAPGRGSVFTLYLPATPAPRPGPDSAHTASGGASSPDAAPTASPSP